MFSQAEYIWLDGTKPTQELRSKTRVLPAPEQISIDVFPKWSFDGSSTGQASGDQSDLILKPAAFTKDPLRGPGNFLVMCEVFDSSGQPHETNARAKLREQMELLGKEQEPWIGFEQEYTLFHGQRPAGWPSHGFPSPQGPFYCGVGTDRIAGRALIESHTQACIDAGIMIHGTNAEVMLGQWEFQIGYRGYDGESPDPLTVSDHLWLARWLLLRLAEDHGMMISFTAKPMKGDWNGAGAHTNFSTKAMRDERVGWLAIKRLIAALEKTHESHIEVYGHGLEERLTGHHETCHISRFAVGERDRGASVRIPDMVVKNRCGYIEDRRPGANCDPYKVSHRMLKTLRSALSDEEGAFIAP